MQYDGAQNSINCTLPDEILLFENGHFKAGFGKRLKL